MVKYVFPANFKGAFILIGEDRDGVRIKADANQQLVLNVPESGILRITDRLPNRSWHRSQALYSDGSPLAIARPGKSVPPESIALRLVGTMAPNEDWYVVGTGKDFEDLWERLAREHANRASVGKSKFA